MLRSLESIPDEWGGTGSKFTVPPSRPGQIDRARLLRTTEPFLRRPVVSIQAPAGYGKSTFAAQLCRHSAAPTAWISLREADNDPAFLLNRMTEALDALGTPATGHQPRRRVKPLAQAVAEFIDSWRLQAPLRLVVDDAHLLTSSASIGVLRSLVEAASEEAQVLLISRRALSVGLPRRRMSGDLLEVHAEALALDEAEVAQLLTQWGSEVPPDEIRRLWQLTEGWPAAIGLAAVARSSESLERSITTLSGTNRHVADYFLEEVLTIPPPDFLGLEPADMRRFLTCISPLPVFCASICDVVARRADSATILAFLAESNLFIVPLDADGQWYRFHHLFQEMLEDELVRSDEDEVAIFDTGAEWYEVHGRPDEAFELARRSGDLDRAGRILLGERDLVDRGRLNTLRLWLDSLTEAEIESDAQLTMGAAWIAAQSGDVERARRYLAVAEGADLDVPSADGSTTLRASWLNLRGTITADGVHQMLDDGLAVVASESSTRSIRLAGAYRIVGVAQLMLGRPTEAIAALHEVHSLTEHEPALQYVRAFCLGHFALAQIDLGQWSQLEHSMCGATSLLDEYGHTIHGLPIWLARASMQAHRGAHADAAATMRTIQALMPLTMGGPCLRAELAYRAAVVAHEIHDDRTACDLVDDARLACGRVGDAGTIPERLDQLESRMAHAITGLATLTPAEMRVLHQLATHRTLQEIADHLFVSRTTVKTHVASIYSKLAVSTRADAVGALGD